ncbi:unnamed protein product [Arabis nemorensis]|uniref:Uncharacterized protein n=1 Tax=Arabis nemorensis TaxID=586526 RepID=A0A565CJA4_9BRAS|nr:unnamed protein product [Arabis nemorensis]
MYRRKSEDGGYFSPAPTTVSQTNPQPPIGYWQGNNNNIPGNVYTTMSPNLPEQQQQQVYMFPAQSQAPGTLYHSVMRPPTQGNQGYYPPVQRLHHPDGYMEQQSQQGYNVVQPQQPQYSGGPQVMTSAGPMGLQETAPYSQMGNQVYYTVAGDGMMVQPQQPPAQPQYQGMGQPVSGVTDSRTGPDGKVTVNMAPKGVSQNSDCV